MPILIFSPGANFGHHPLFCFLGDKAMQQLNKEKKNNPHLYNLNFDPQLNGKIIHILKKQETEIGNRKGSDSDICMIGPG